MPCFAIQRAKRDWSANWKYLHKLPVFGEAPDIHRHFGFQEVWAWLMNFTWAQAWMTGPFRCTTQTTYVVVWIVPGYWRVNMSNLASQPGKILVETRGLISPQTGGICIEIELYFHTLEISDVAEKAWVDHSTRLDLPQDDTGDVTIMHSHAIFDEVNPVIIGIYIALYISCHSDYDIWSFGIVTEDTMNGLFDKLYRLFVEINTAEGLFWWLSGVIVHLNILRIKIYCKMKIFLKKKFAFYRKINDYNYCMRN